MTNTITTSGITIDFAGLPIVCANDKITNTILADPSLSPVQTFQTFINNLANTIILDSQNNKTTTKVTEQCKEAKKESNPLYYAYDSTLKIKVPYIKDVKILCPNKVLQFTFNDKTIIKTICLDADQFDFEFAFYLAYAKYLWQKVLTPAGIERKAKEYTETKFFIKLVNKAFKTINEKKKEEERLAKEKEEKKVIAERRAAKKAAKAKKQREARIMETVEAIKRAKQ